VVTVLVRRTGKVCVFLLVFVVTVLESGTYSGPVVRTRTPVLVQSNIGTRFVDKIRRRSTFRSTVKVDVAYLYCEIHEVPCSVDRHGRFENYTRDTESCRSIR
jgi:hypothetical protein